MFYQSIKLSIKTTKTDDESKQINNQSERNYTETRFDANWLWFRSTAVDQWKPLACETVQIGHGLQPKIANTLPIVDKLIQ